MRRRFARFRATPVAVVCLALAAPVQAASGKVLQPDGKPVEGARVCTFSRGEPRDCVATDAEGFYSLAEGNLREVRIRFPGYLIERVDAGPLDTPVRLRPAARLEVSFVSEPGGEPVGGVSFFLLRPNGWRQGPMGPSGETGVVIVQTLEPGPATVSVYAPGYDAGPGREVRLEGGETTELRVPLTPRPNPAGP